MRESVGHRNMAELGAVNGGEVVGGHRLLLLLILRQRVAAEENALRRRRRGWQRKGAESLGLCGCNRERATASIASYELLLSELCLRLGRTERLCWTVQADMIKLVHVGRGHGHLGKLVDELRLMAGKVIVECWGEHGREVVRCGEGRRRRARRGR